MQTEAAELTVQIELEHSKEEELDELTRDLLDEVSEFEIEAAELARGGKAPEGAKAADAVTIGAIAIAVLPAVLPRLVEFLQVWLLRGEGRTMKLRATVAGRKVEFEGSAEGFKELLRVVGSSNQQGPKRSR